MNQKETKNYIKNYILLEKIKQSKIQHKYMLKRRYNITDSKYNEMLITQGGCCAICGRHESLFKNRLAVDHDHQTGIIRSLLCPTCNTHLGYYETHKNKLDKYLASHA